MFKPIVVSDRSEGRRVGVQGEGPEGLPLSEKAAGKLCSDVLRIGCRSAISTDKQLPSGRQRRRDHLHGARNSVRELGKGPRNFQVLRPDFLDSIYLFGGA